MTFFIALFILLMQFLWKYIDDLVGKGFEWYIIAKLLFYASSTFIPLALPLAILLSSIMTLGNLGEHYETVAIKAAGISLQRFLRPLIGIVFIIVIGAFYFSNNILPVANLKMSSLLYDVRSKKPALNIEEGIFYKGIEGYVIKVGRKENDGKTMHKITIFDHTEKSGNNSVTVAEWGKMETTPDERYLIFSLYEGCTYEDELNGRGASITRPFRRTYFKEEIIRFDLSGFQLTRTKEDLFKDHYKMLNLKQLRESMDSLEKVYKDKQSRQCDQLLSRFKHFRNIDSASNILETEDPIKPKITDNFKNSRVKQDIVDEALKRARNNKDKVFYTIRDFDTREEHIRRHQIEWHRKLTLSFACMVLFFIGAPLGAIIRKGGFGLPIVMSVIFFVVFHVLSMTGEKMVREGASAPFQGMWMASLIYLPLGILLTYMATTDSSIFDITAYTSFFHKTFNRKKHLRRLRESENTSDNQ